MSKLPTTLKQQGYKEIICCRRCKHMDSKEVACGSQSFMTITTCRLAGEQVSVTGTCDKAKR